MHSPLLLSTHWPQPCVCLVCCLVCFVAAACNQQLDGFGVEWCTSRITGVGGMCSLTCPSGTVAPGTGLLEPGFATCSANGEWDVQSRCQLGELCIPLVSLRKLNSLGLMLVLCSHAGIHTALSCACGILQGLTMMQDIAQVRGSYGLTLGRSFVCMLGLRVPAYWLPTGLTP